MLQYYAKLFDKNKRNKFEFKLLLRVSKLLESCNECVRFVFDECLIAQPLAVIVTFNQAKCNSWGRLMTFDRNFYISKT